MHVYSRLQCKERKNVLFSEFTTRKYLYICSIRSEVMNQVLKLRCHSSFIRKFYGVAFKWMYNDCVQYTYPLLVKSAQAIDMCSLPYSYCQVRQYAKRAQGKVPKSGKGKTMKLTDEEMADVIDIEDYREQLHRVAEKLRNDYIENLSIRSAANNIINITVKIGDENYALNELAIISKKNPNLIAINMADFPEAIKPAIRAITESGSGLNPQQDGTMVYVNVPKMTREHRETLAKNSKSLYVKAKSEIREIQNTFLRDAKDKTELSEDLVFNASNQIMAMAEQCATDLEKIMKNKQKELLGEG